MAALFRLTVLLSVLVCASAGAVDCPANPDTGATWDGWPTTRTQSGTWSYTHNATGTVRCGLTMNYALSQTGSGAASLSAALAIVRPFQSGSSTTYNEHEVAHCTFQRNSTTWAAVIVWEGNLTSNNAFARWTAEAYISTTATTCTTTTASTTACAAYANVNTGGFANDQALTFEPPDTMCLPNPGGGGTYCAAFRRENVDDSTTKYKWFMTKSSPTTADFIWRVQYTGLTCSPPIPQPETVTATGENCANNFCQGIDAQKGCGFFNDKYICPESIQPTDCYANADGSRFCNSQAPTPPVPDNGTPGVPATPNDTLNYCSASNSCNTTNYYNPTTVTGSSRPPGDGSGTGGTGTVGPGMGDTGDGTGAGGGTPSSVSGGVACDAAPTCDGDAVECAQLFQQWRARCPVEPTATEVHDAIGATAGELDGSALDGSSYDIGEFSETGGIEVGACPAPLSVTVMGETLSMDVWVRGCEMATMFAPFVMAMGWLLAGLMFVRGS